VDKDDKLLSWLKRFLTNDPNGSKEKFVKFVREEEAREINEKFIIHKNKVLKNLNKGLYHK
jgi:hypothetical protein